MGGFPGNYGTADECSNYVRSPARRKVCSSDLANLEATAKQFPGDMPRPAPREVPGNVRDIAERWVPGSVVRKE